MSNCNAVVSYFWWIESKVEWVSLTWSSTLVEVEVGWRTTYTKESWKRKIVKSWWKKKISVVIDAWMFQWSKSDISKNKEVDDKILNADYLILTHAHSDHSWRVPYLFKKWFKWKVITTKLTFDQSIEMWNDYIKLTKREIELVKHRNKKLAEDLKNAFFIVKTIDRLKYLQSNGFKKEGSDVKLKSDLGKLLKELGLEKDEAYEKSKEKLEYYKKNFWVENPSDIKLAFEEVPELLYSKKDLEEVAKNIQILSPWEELELKDFHPVDSSSDENINYIIERISWGFTGKIPVLDRAKTWIVFKLNQLRDDLKSKSRNNKREQEQNNELYDRLTEAFNYIEWFDKDSKDIEELEIKNSHLLDIDEEELNDDISRLSTIFINWFEFDLKRLLYFYESNANKLLIDNNVYGQLKSELEKLWIEWEWDITMCLPDFPPHDYTTYDLNKSLRKIKFTTWSEVKTDDIFYIDSLDSTSIPDFLKMYSSKIKSRIFIKESIKEEFIKKLNDFINDHNLKISLNQKFRKEANDSFDLVEIFDSDNTEYLRKNLNKYSKVLNSISSDLKLIQWDDFKDIKVNLDNIDDFIYSDIWVKKWNIISKLNDSRIFEILKSKEWTYYIAPGIRNKVKEKLIKRLKEIEDIKKRAELAKVRYEKSLRFKRIYEAKNSFELIKDYKMTFDEANEILQRNNISSEYDINNICFGTKYIPSVKVIEEFLWEITFVDNDKDFDKTSEYFYIDNLDDNLLEEIGKIESNRFHASINSKQKKKIFVNSKISKDDIIKKIEDLKTQTLEFEGSERTRISKLKDNLNKALKVVNTFQELKNAKISREEYEKAKTFLQENWLQTRDDLKSIVTETSKLYSLSDYEEILEYIIAVWDDFDLQNSINRVFIDSEDDERIFDLPYQYNNEFKIFYIPEELKAKVKKKLHEWIWFRFKILNQRRDKRRELSKKLNWLKFLEDNADKIFNLPGDTPSMFFFKRLQDVSWEIERIKKLLKEAKKAKKLSNFNKSDKQTRLEVYNRSSALLKEYNIKSENDIKSIIKELNWLPIWGKTPEEIDKFINEAIDRLKPVHINQNETILEKVLLRFYDAWHLEWSIQVLVSLVVDKVDNILNDHTKKIPSWSLRRKSYTNLLLSWDLWRIKDPSLSWTIEKVSIDGKLVKLDYLQVETTYAWRFHPEKSQSVEKLVSSINDTNWISLIPAFSMQRTQEILMILLNERLKSQDLVEERNKLLEDKREIEERNILDITTQSILREIDEEIEVLNRKIFDKDIICHSPLWKRITEIYLNNEGISEKYYLLRPEVQIRLFWREVVKYITSEEEVWEVYSSKTENKKVVISSSWMCEWWSVLNHLKHVLPNPNHRVIFIWYTPDNTRWWKIKKQEGQISIDWELYDIVCNVSDILWFSWHPDEEEIMWYLREYVDFSKWALVSLTHWWEWRISLSTRAKEILRVNKKRVKILVPDLWDSVRIPL